MDKLSLMEKIFNEGEITNIYSYYDMPLTYISLYNKRYYFHHFISTNNTTDTWFVTEINREEKENIHTMRTHPREILINHYKSKKLHILKTDFDNTVLSLENYSSYPFEESYFPTPNSVFNYDFLSNEKLDQIVKTLYKEPIEKVTFSFSDSQNSDRMLLDVFSNITKNLVDVFKTFGNGTLAAEAIPRGSFGLTIVPVDSNVDSINIFSEQSLEKLVNIFKTISSGNKNEVTNFINQLLDDKNGIQTAYKLNEFLKEVNKHDYTFSIKDKYFEPLSSYSKSNYYLTNKIDSMIISKTTEKMLESISAQLISFNSKTGNIRILFEENQISGYLTKDQYRDKKLVTPSNIKADVKYIQYPDGTDFFELISVKDITYFSNEQNEEEVLVDHQIIVKNT